MLCVILLVAGCFHVDYSIDIDDDGSGLIQFIIEYDRKALEILPALAMDAGSDSDLDDLGAGTEDFDAEEACEAMLEGLDLSEMNELGSLDGVVAESDTELSPCRVSSRVSWDADARAAVVSELFDDDGELELLPEGGWVFELGSLESMGLGSAEDMEDAAGDESFDAMLEAVGLSPPSVKLSVALPGRPVEHNADAVSAGAFIWEFDLFDPPGRLFAETAPAEHSSSWVWIVVAAVAALVAFVAALGWRLYGRKPAPLAGQPPEAAAQADHPDNGAISDPPAAT